MATVRGSGVRSVIWSAALLGTTMLAGVPAAMAQSAEGATMVDEVIVTAQKRDENLQDVPISIQALGTEKLDQMGVSDFNDYVKLLPSVSYQTVAPGFSSVYMRGVASGGDGNHSGSLPSVGIYLDEQPITTIQGALDVNVYDMARVEALAGPQGTLYGASSQAGTIRLITNKPDPSGFSAAIDTELNTVTDGGVGGSVEGYVNLPVHDRAALRLVGWYREDAGYIDNVPGSITYATSGFTLDNADRVEEDYNTTSTYGGRAALRIDLNDDWTVTPAIMGQHQEANGSFAYDPQRGDLAISHFYPEGGEDRWYQAALTVEGKLGSWDLVYAGAYMDRDVDTRSDYSDYSYFYDTLYGYGAYWTDDFGVPLDNPSQYIEAQDRYKRESHEIRVASPTDQPMRFVLGLFWQNQQHNIEQKYKIDDLAEALEVTGQDDVLWLTQQFREDEDRAVFGEIAYDFTDKLTVTGGLRLFQADNSLRGFFGFGTGYSGSTGEAACFAGPILPDSPCTNLVKRVQESGNTHRLNLTYKFDEDRMIYATWSTGYRPGGINRRGTLPPYSSDFLTNYELGWKTSWRDGSLRWNGAVYALRWDDFQFSILGSQGLTEIKNAAQARVLGIESDVVWRPTAALTLTAAGAYTNAELSEDYCGFLSPTGEPETNCAAPLAPEGTELPITPKFKGNVTARYEFDLAGFDAHVQGSAAYVGSNWTDLRLFERAIIGKQDAYTVVDFTTGVENEDWKLTLFLNNAFDERASLYRFAQCAEAVCGGRTYVVPNRPRTFGIRLGRRF
ncbi:MAG TPA: TonB-dependent receptor [Caulobacteraceae bacterium]|nr:TonB-dependent receptor [Caulobacteraceae bacterium]